MADEKRLTYDAPCAMRIGAMTGAEGQDRLPCDNGSGNVNGCASGNSTLGKGCENPGSSAAADCHASGSSAADACLSPGSDVTST